MGAAITEELRVLVEAEVERAIAQFQKLDKTVEKNEKQTKSLGDALDSLSRKSMVVSAAFGGAGIASIKFAGELEKTQKSLEVLLRDAEKATQIKDEWTTLAAETPFQTDDIDRAGKMLLAFGVGADKVTETLRQIGDVSAATGSSISELADLYGKAKVQGRLFAQDINQFQGRGIPIVQALAKQLGVAESSIRQMVEAGKIGFPEIEKAFTSMTGPGGQFSGMMEELSKTTLGKFSTATDNAKLAMASFGEVLLPVANDVLDAAAGIFSAIQEMDDGTKRFIVTFGGIVTASGPIIFAVHGINTALAALAANPAFLVIAGSVVAIGLVAGAVSKYNNQLSDAVKGIEKQSKAAESLLSSYESLNGEKALDKTTSDQLIKLYPQLAGKIKEYETSVDDARRAVEELNKTKAEEAARSQIKLLQITADRIESDTKIYEEKARKFQDAHDRLLASLQNKKITQKVYDQEAAALNDLFKPENMLKSISEAKAEFAAALESLNEKIKTTGLRLNESLQFEKVPITVTPVIDTGNLEPSAELKKSWQAWFEEITGVSEKKFGTSGEKAGTLYVDGLELTLSHSKSIAELLGDKFDLSSALKSQQDEIRKTLSELFNINPDDINESFTSIDASIAAMIEEFRSIGEQRSSLDYADAVAELQQKIADLAKSEAELAVAAHMANGYTEEQARILAGLNNEFDNEALVREYEQSVKELGLSQEELARLTLVANGATDEQLGRFDEAIKKTKEFNDATKSLSIDNLMAEKIESMLTEWGKFDSAVNKTLSNLASQLALSFIEFPFDALEGLGKAFAQGADAGDALRDSIAGAAQQLLDNLPMMLMQAGLQLILQGQWPLGLGLLAAAGAISFTKGIVDGTVKKAEDEADTKNASGNAYGNTGVIPFAKGSAFTNSIINEPTLFKFAKGTGLMGEAGPEAIVPLARTASGDLGIRAEGMGSGAQVTVTVNNYTSEKASVNETQGEDGSRQIEVMIGSAINSHLSSGRADRALSGRYGLKATGV